MRKIPERESDIEDYLVGKVKAMGGEVRKVKWEGRNGAPDRLVMLPEEYGPDTTIWVELKAPGRGLIFPATPHERQQHREHDRMRKMGQRVEVIDSYAGVDALF
jgi:hypothetical protein